MNSNPKIAFYTPSLSLGGRERVLSMLINYFQKKGEAEIYLFLYGKNRDIVFPIEDGVKVIEPDFQYSDYPSSISLIKTLWFVRRSVKKHKIDVIVSFEEMWNRFVLLSTAGINKRKIISNRNTPNRDFGYFDNTLAKLLYPHADVLIAQTEIAREIYSKQYRLKECVVIGNPINEVVIPKNNKRENVIISIGRLMNTKNHDRLIRIFSQTNHENWKLIIVGGDFAKQNNSVKLKELIKELSLEDKVELAGMQKDVNSWLLKSKIFAFTSNREGFPNVLGEAMAAGLPVVSYDCVAGPADMIDNGENGFLIPLYDDKVFVEKLQSLMDNKQEIERMSANARNKITKFDAEIISEKFYNIIFPKELR